jgi:hypothetical protein
MRNNRKALLRTPTPSLAADACRLLILAYKDGHEHVDWSDVQQALDKALQAFDLPPEFVEAA